MVGIACRAEILAEAGLPTVAFLPTIALAKVEAKVGSLTYFGRREAPSGATYL